MRAEQGHVTRVVTHPFLLFERRIVLFVHADQPQIRDRRKQRRASTDRDAKRVVSQTAPHLRALGATEPAVQNCDLLAEARSKSTYQLRRQRDLWNQHDGAAAAFQALGDGVQVHLGFSRTRHSLQQEVLGVMRFDGSPNRRDRGGLMRIQCFGFIPRDWLIEKRVDCARLLFDRHEAKLAQALGGPTSIGVRLLELCNAARSLAL
jgi:hypothetical protein